MITPEQFERLNFQQQVAMIRNAVFVEQREGSNYTALLYQLDGFYIEAYKHKKYQYIYKVESFSGMEKSSFYVDKIGNISQLFLKIGLFAEYVVQPFESLPMLA